MKNIFGGCCLSIFINLDIHITYYIYNIYPDLLLGILFPAFEEKTHDKCLDFPSFSHARYRPEFSGTGYEIKFPRYRMSPQDSGLGHEYHWWRFLQNICSLLGVFCDVSCFVFWTRHSATLMSFMNLQSLSFEGLSICQFLRVLILQSQQLSNDTAAMTCLLTSWVFPIRWKLSYETQVPLLLCTGETYRQQSKPIQTSRWILDNRWWYLRQVSHPCMAFFGFQRRSIGHTQRTYLFGVIGFSFLDSIFRWHRCLHIPWMRDRDQNAVVTHKLSVITWSEWTKNWVVVNFQKNMFFFLWLLCTFPWKMSVWKTTFPWRAKGLVSGANCSTSGARVPFPDSPWDSNIYLHLSLSIHLVTLQWPHTTFLPPKSSEE